ncbi:hypothetical protein Trydic_g1932 [Trypoxylus dichotomus]
MTKSCGYISTSICLLLLDYLTRRLSQILGCAYLQVGSSLQLNSCTAVPTSRILAPARSRRESRECRGQLVEAEVIGGGRIEGEKETDRTRKIWNGGFSSGARKVAWWGAAMNERVAWLRSLRHHPITCWYCCAAPFLHYPERE